MASYENVINGFNPGNNAEKQGWGHGAFSNEKLKVYLGEIGALTQMIRNLAQNSGKKVLEGRVKDSKYLKTSAYDGEKEPDNTVKNFIDSLVDKTLSEVLRLFNNKRGNPGGNNEMNEWEPNILKQAVYCLLVDVLYESITSNKAELTLLKKRFQEIYTLFRCANNNMAQYVHGRVTGESAKVPEEIFAFQSLKEGCKHPEEMLDSPKSIEHYKTSVEKYHTRIKIWEVLDHHWEESKKFNIAQMYPSFRDVFLHEKSKELIENIWKYPEARKEFVSFFKAYRASLKGDNGLEYYKKCVEYLQLTQEKIITPYRNCIHQMLQCVRYEKEPEKYWKRCCRRAIEVEEWEEEEALLRKSIEPISDKKNISGFPHILNLIISQEA